MRCLAAFFCFGYSDFVAQACYGVLPKANVYCVLYGLLIVLRLYVVTCVACLVLFGARVVVLSIFGVVGYVFKYEGLTRMTRYFNGRN